MDISEILASKTASFYRRRLKIINRELKPLGINSNQSTLLVKIWRNPGMNQNQLTELLNIEKTSLSKLLKTLDRKNLVYKELNPDDNRYYQIYLSKEGEELLMKCRAILSRIWDQFLEGVSEEEKELMLKITEKIYSNMEEL